MRPATFVLPGPVERTGGYIYDAKMIDRLPRHGWAVDVVMLPAVDRSGETMRTAATALESLPDGAVVIVDGLALGAMPDVIEAHASRLRIVGLIHLPLAADVTRSHDEAAALEPLERRALAATSLTVVTSRATLPMLDRYALPRSRVRVVEPGTDRAALGDRSRFATGIGPRPVELLCVATVGAGKGHDVLLDALALSGCDDWHLTCAGSLTRDAATVDRVRSRIAAHGWSDRVSLTGELDEGEVAACYDSTDLFVLATRQETYGMAVAEAISHGLPVIATSTGAIASLVGDDAGIVVEPDDTAAFADALRCLIGDSSARARYAEGSLRRREFLPTWDDACEALSVALNELDHG